MQLSSRRSKRQSLQKKKKRKKVKVLYAYFHYCIKSSLPLEQQKKYLRQGSQNIQKYFGTIRTNSYFPVRIKKLKLKIGVSAKVEYILLAWKYEMLVFFISTQNFTSQIFFLLFVNLFLLTYLIFFFFLRIRKRDLIGACMCSQSFLSCQTLCDPVNCNLPGFSVHGILQARILE